MLTVFNLFQNRYALILFILSLALCILDRILKKSRGFVIVFSAFLSLISVGLDITYGASLYEGTYLLIVILLFNLEASHEL